MLLGTPSLPRVNSCISSLPFSYRNLLPQSQKAHVLMWIPVPVPLWVLGSAIKGQEICPAGEIPPPQTTLKSREMEYPAGAPLLQLLTVLGMKATPAQGSSLWCSLWLLLHSFSAESTWLRSTSLTMNYEQCASSKGHSLLI